jgi:CheY-like chemotaxis protein
MPDLSGHIILIAEDQYILADDLTQALLQSGAGVLGPVGSLTDAMSLLEATDRLDGAVLDINLRGEMIYPLANALAARSVPYVFITGYARVALPNRYNNVPRYEKPIDSAFVAQALALHIRDRTSL